VSARLAASPRPVSVNLLGVVEHPVLGDGPYRIDVDGHPYLPVGDGGIVLGLQLGDSVFGRRADHAAPGACLVHPDPAARHALATYSCIGNQVRVRSGHAAGALGVVIGKRGKEGRVIAAFRPAELATMRPSDEVSVRACGQGCRPDAFPADVPRPTAPDLTTRSFRIGPTVATHLMIRVVTNQCTGGPDYAGDQDNDPRSTSDCTTGNPAVAQTVRISELEAFTF